MKKLYFLLASLSTMAAFAQPANDECSGAIPVPINPDYNCTTVVSGTVAGATASQGAPSVGYIGTPDNDVWFSFVATNPTHRISMINRVGAGNDLVHQVIGGTCSNMTAINLSDPETSTVSGLVVGETSYIRVYSYYTNNNHIATFDVCIGTPPPPPANDNCGGAIVASINPTFECSVVTPGVLTGATASPVSDNGSGTPSDDVWFRFIATNTSHRFELLNRIGDTSDLVHEIMAGTCEGLQSMNVSDAENSLVSGFTPGLEYFVRVYSFQTGPVAVATFDLCIGTPPPPPANDDCAGSIEVPVNAALLCETMVSATLTSATDSGVTDNGAGVPNDDVWFHFTATSTSHIISIENVLGTPTNLVHEVMSGACNGLTSVLISDPNSSTLTNLVPGANYYVRVFSFQTGPAMNTTFGICVKTPPSMVNDECGQAIALTVNPDLNCATITAGTVLGATQSPVADNGAGTPNDDVWFYFIATNTSHSIDLLNISGSTADLVHELMSGDCDNPESIYVSDNNDSIATGLVPGQPYYVRVFTWANSATATTVFNICIGTMPPPPANDDCEGAVTLIPAATLAEGLVVGSVASATDTANVEEPSCASYNGGDVWYSVVVPASGNISIETIGANGINSFDSGMAAYAGACGALSQIACDDDGGDTGNFSKISLTGRTPGETIYVRVWEYSNDEVEPFSIGAYDASLATSTFDQTGFVVYPNPTQNVLNVSAQLNIETVEIFNLVGQQVFGKEINQTNYTLDLSSLPSGTYLVRATSGGASKTVKVLKK